MLKLENEWRMTIFLPTILLKKNKLRIRAENIRGYSNLGVKLWKIANALSIVSWCEILRPDDFTLLQSVSWVMRFKSRWNLGNNWEYNRKKSRRKIRRACPRLSRSGQERLSRRIANNTLSSGRDTKQFGEEGVLSRRSKSSSALPRSTHRIGSPGLGLLHARSVRLAVAAGSGLSQSRRWHPAARNTRLGPIWKAVVAAAACFRAGF